MMNRRDKFLERCEQSQKVRGLQRDMRDYENDVFKKLNELEGIGASVAIAIHTAAITGEKWLDVQALAREAVPRLLATAHTIEQALRNAEGA